MAVVAAPGRNAVNFGHPVIVQMARPRFVNAR